MSHDKEYVDLPSIDPLKSGTVNDDGESCTHIAIFDRKAVEAVYGPIDEETDRNELAQDLTGWYDSYGGPGRWFRRGPWCKVYKHKILVKQFCALDI